MTFPHIYENEAKAASGWCVCDLRLVLYGCEMRILRAQDVGLRHCIAASRADVV